MPTTHAPPVFDDAAWRAAHATRPYALPGTTYEDFAPAYRYGALVADEQGRTEFAEMEPVLAEQWITARGTSPLTWEQARPAVQEAYAAAVRDRPVKAARADRPASARPGHGETRAGPRAKAPGAARGGRKATGRPATRGRTRATTGASGARKTGRRSA